MNTNIHGMKGIQKTVLVRETVKEEYGNIERRKNFIVWVCGQPACYVYPVHSSLNFKNKEEYAVLNCDLL